MVSLERSVRGAVPIPFETRDGRSGIVRVARPRDADAAVAMVRDSAAQRPRVIATVEEEVWTPREWRRYRAGWSPAGLTLIAEVERTPAGVLGASRSTRGAARHTAEVGITVAAAHRGIGVGPALMRAAEAWAREFGVSRLELRVFPTNERARRMYASLGYREEGVEVRSARFPEGDLDVIRMAKMLDAGRT